MDDLAARYARIWADGRPLVASGAFDADPVPVAGDRRWGMSAVLVPGAPLRIVLAGAAAELGSASLGPHCSYTGPALHCTVRSLTNFAATPEPGLAERYAEDVSQAVQDIDAITITYRGLSGGSGGVFACGYPSQELSLLRHRLLARELGRGPADQGDGARVRDTAHISLMVFRPSAGPERVLAAKVDALADEPFGTAVFRAVRIVAFTVGPDHVELRTLAEVPLG